MRQLRDVVIAGDTGDYFLTDKDNQRRNKRYRYPSLLEVRE